MKQNSIYLSVVIPAYNEKDNFKDGSLAKVSDYLSKQTYTWEVIVVDDGSTDGTTDLVEEWIKTEPNFKLIKNEHKGKGPAVKTGVIESKGKLVLFTDFDQATPMGEIEKLIPFINKGYEVVIGSREVKGSKREEEPFYRHLMGRGWNLLVQTLAIRGIHDTQCGFKLFENKSAKKLFNKMHVYSNGKEKKAFVGAFDVEILFIAQKWGLKIAEVPIHWTHIKTDRVDAVRTSLKMFLDLLKIRMASFQGKYELKS